MNSYRNLGSPDFPNDFSDADVPGDKRPALMQALADGKVEVVPGPAIPVEVEAPESEGQPQDSPIIFYRYTGATHAQYIGGLPARDLTDKDLTGDQRPLMFAAIALGIYAAHAVDAQPVASAEDEARVKAEQEAALKALQDAEEAAKQEAARLAELKATEEAEAARLQKLAEEEAALKTQTELAQQALEAAKQAGLSAKKAKEIAALIDAGQVAEAQAALAEFSPKK